MNNSNFGIDWNKRIASNYSCFVDDKDEDLTWDEEDADVSRKCTLPFFTFDTSAFLASVETDRYQGMIEARNSEYIQIKDIFDECVEGDNCDVSESRTELYSKLSQTISRIMSTARRSSCG